MSSALVLFLRLVLPDFALVISALVSLPAELRAAADTVKRSIVASFRVRLHEAAVFSVIARWGP